MDIDETCAAQGHCGNQARHLCTATKPRFAHLGRAGI